MWIKLLGIFSFFSAALQPFGNTAHFSSLDLPALPPPPVKIAEIAPPEFSAASVITVDLDTGIVLYEKNADAKRPIASITKLMTANVILEENRLNEVVTVSDAIQSASGSRMWLVPKEKLTVESLLYGALIPSANDAATALAVHNAGSTGAFVKKMNTKANMLGMSDTHFANPSGFDDEENYSTARDLVTLARYLYRKPFIRHAVQLKRMNVRSLSGKFTHALESTNDLLFLKNASVKFKGLKTGMTAQAGQSFIGLAENNLGRRIITVVLDSDARFKESRMLAEWTFNAYQW